MSLSFLNAFAPILSLVIYPDRLVWTYESSGFKKKLLINGQSSCSVNTAAPWENVISLLPKLLANTEIKATKVRVLISNRLTRFSVIPNPDSTRNSEELALLVKHIFQRVYGDKNNGWIMKVSDSGIGQPALASAIDHEMMNSLTSIIAASKKKLISLQPYLMAAYNKVCHVLPANLEDAIFVFAEPLRLCLLARKNHNWVSVQQFNVDNDWLNLLEEKIITLIVQSDLLNLQNIIVVAPEFNGDAERYHDLLPLSSPIKRMQFKFISLKDLELVEPLKNYYRALFA